MTVVVPGPDPVFLVEQKLYDSCVEAVHVPGVSNNRAKSTTGAVPRARARVSGSSALQSTLPAIPTRAGPSATTPKPTRSRKPVSKRAARPASTSSVAKPRSSSRPKKPKQ